MTLDFVHTRQYIILYPLISLTFDLRPRKASRNTGHDMDDMTSMILCTHRARNAVGRSSNNVQNDA